MVYVLREKNEVLSVRKRQRDAIDDMDGLNAPTIESIEWVGDPLDETLPIFLAWTGCGECVQGSHDAESLEKDLDVTEFSYNLG